MKVEVSRVCWGWMWGHRGCRVGEGGCRVGEGGCRVGEGGCRGWREDAGWGREDVGDGGRMQGGTKDVGVCIGGRVSGLCTHALCHDNTLPDYDCTHTVYITMQRHVQQPPPQGGRCQFLLFSAHSLGAWRWFLAAVGPSSWQGQRQPRHLGG